jgi:hypothetical protein
MRIVVALAVLSLAAARPLAAQETKPVPKDSMRVSIPGCTKGQIFTAARRTQDEPGSVDVPEGMHMRMNGPKKMMGEIKSHEGSMIVITGLVKRGQLRPDGIAIGGGIRVMPGASPGSGGVAGPAPVGSQLMIDLEGWRPGAGSCPTR